MSYPITIWSKAYAPSVDNDTYSVQVDKYIWEKAMNQEGSKRKFLQIKHPYGLDDWIAPIGQPVSIEHVDTEEERRYAIYMPLWMIDASHLEGEGIGSTVHIIDEEYFPQATRIVFRVIDSAIYNADIKAELERALSAMGVIREHTTLHIPVEALGGYPVEVFVSQTEPANLVLCDGEEVVVEFEEPVDQISPPESEPEEEAPTPEITTTTHMIPEIQTSSTFSAFQGSGNVLGGSNAHIPEWRRGLPPPRGHR